jgi:hypothetical protein
MDLAFSRFLIWLTVSSTTLQRSVAVDEVDGVRSVNTIDSISVVYDD